MTQQQKDIRRIAFKLARIRTILLEIKGNGSIEQIRRDIDYMDHLAKKAMLNIGYISTFGKNDAIYPKKNKEAT